MTLRHNDEAAYSRGHSLLSRRSPLRERAFNRAIETPRPALNSVGCLRLRRDGVSGRRAPRSSLFPHTTVGSAQRHIRLITKHHTERPRWRDGLSSAWRGAAASRRGNTHWSRIFTSSRRRRRHVGRLGATLASRNNRRCCANVFKKHRARPQISGALPEAVTTTHPRAPVTREASRHATRYNKRLALPSAPAPCHNSRVMGRPPVPQRTLSSDRPEDRRAVQASNDA